MTGYVPTTGQVREAYIVNKGQWRQSAGAGFDRWLDQVKTDAWDAGAQAQAAAYGMDKDTGPNPYRTGADQ